MAGTPASVRSSEPGVLLDRTVVVGLSLDLDTAALVDLRVRVTQLDCYVTDHLVLGEDGGGGGGGGGGG